MTEKDILIIEAGRTERQYWKDIWRYRELFYFLAWRDILVRYKQTVVGIAWALIQPFLTMVVFSVIFGKFVKLPSDGVPYPILIFTAILPWQFFANSLNDASVSLIGDASLISKIYFPRLIIPSSAMITSFIDFLISAAILAGLMFWYGFIPGWRMVVLPLLIIIAFAASMGAGLWLSVLNVKYRDFRYVVPFILQLGMYISPDKWRILYSLNPMVGVIDGFRWAILGGNVKIFWPGFVVSLALVALLFVTGILYFRKMEKTFADVI